MLPIQVYMVVALGLALLAQAVDNKVQTITINSPTSGAALNPLNAALNTYLQSRNQGNGPPHGAGGYDGPLYGGPYGAHSGPYGAFGGPSGAYGGQGGGPYGGGQLGAYGQGSGPYGGGQLGSYGQGGGPYGGGQLGAYGQGGGPYRGGQIGAYGQGGAYGPNYRAPYGAGAQFGYPGYPGSYTVRVAGKPASGAFYPGQAYGSNYGGVPGYGGPM